jgi:hypothetical protein
MPFTNYTNLDFDQIKTSIKDYLRANSNFTDFDFEGSNFSVLIDVLAYNTYINAFNTNLTINEAFLDSATVRENVVSLARNIGYVPRSRKCSTATVSFDIETNETGLLYLQPELLCVGSVKDSSYIFSIADEITASIIDGVASFNNITIYQGRHIKQTFNVDTSLDQRFILPNSFIDTSTIRVYVKGPNDIGTGKKYSLIDNIITVDQNSEIFLIQEVKDERYELLFGDGIIGKKLENGSRIVVTYIVTDGREGNGASEFSFAGSIKNSNGVLVVPTNETITITTVQESKDGSEIETVDSIKYYAPRIYSSQYRAVTASDYEALIKTEIYPNADIVTVVGGEELNPPEYGSVSISIKPKNGLYISDFDKELILSKLKKYSITGINQKLIDIKVLYVELDSFVYYNPVKSSSPLAVKTKIQKSLTTLAESLYSTKIGGRFKYSKVINIIDDSDSSITSNITKIIIRRNLNCLLNQFAEYELCYGNRFHVDSDGGNIKSTGFKIPSQSGYVNQDGYLYFTDIPNADKKTGIIAVIKPSLVPDVKPQTILQSAGTVDYVTGEIRLNALNIISTEKPNGVVEIQAFPESNDVIGLKDLYLSIDIEKSKINMAKDVITSGENTSGVLFTSDYYKSSYSNGSLIRN